MKQRMVGGMRNEVAQHVKSKLQQSAKSRAAGKFSRGGGGISDPGNFESKVYVTRDAVELSVTSTAEPQPSIFGSPINAYPGMFAEWIEYGQWLDVVHFMDTGEKVKRAARPFFQPAEDELDGELGMLEAMVGKYLE